VLLRLDPNGIEHLSTRIGGGSILVSATNGKTTTTRLLAGALRTGGAPVVTNAAGANLLSGVATTLAESAGNLGGATRGVFEVDEAALPEVAARIHPRAILLMNLFRDQLDRHGELEAIAARWQDMIGTLPATTRLVLCADDPLVASLAPAGADVTWFGIDDPEAAAPALPHASDSTRCRTCGEPLAYAAVWVGHIGAWSCPACGLQRPRPAVRVLHAGLRGTAGSRPIIETPAGRVTLELALPGLHNVLNAAGR
jgi:UDP-N-acetylmuramyl tripeptide synthase